MKNNLHVFLGSTVADAAARPLHWVYNQKKLLDYIYFFLNQDSLIANAIIYHIPSFFL